MKRDQIDRDLLHDYLWKTRDRQNFTTISTGKLADTLGVTVYTMSRILGEMVTETRLRRIGNSRFEVKDPELYMWVHSHLDVQEEPK